MKYSGKRTVISPREYRKSFGIDTSQSGRGTRFSLTNNCKSKSRFIGVRPKGVLVQCSRNFYSEEWLL